MDGRMDEGTDEETNEETNERRGEDLPREYGGVIKSRQRDRNGVRPGSK